MKKSLIALSVVAILSGCVVHRHDGWHDDGRGARGDDRSHDRRHDDDRGRSRNDQGRPDYRGDRSGR
ncbi:MAG: membrane lipoprotein lipid attachment site-containing protein [Burkholderiaceae bacterium]|nr:membrane lipoprotein lipid attachment site-containing protein [Burkholderiaceae bacterium]